MAAPKRNLNIFQRLIRQWDEIHPYNAAQAMRLRGAVDAEAIDRAWNEMIAELDIGATRVAVRRTLKERREKARLSPAVTIVDTDQSLEAHVTVELNRPFDPSGVDPFRPFVRDNGDGTYWAGVVYQHWVADSVSIRVVLREWFLRMFEPALARRSLLRVAQRGYWNRFGTWRANWSAIGGIWSALSWTARLKFCRRPKHRDVSNYRARFALHRLPAGIVPALLDYSRRRGVTMNDLFLAAVVRVCDKLIAAKPNRRKHHLAVGTIVDLRATAPRGAVGRDEFGLFLGFTSVLSRFRHREDWDASLRSIAIQNVRDKKTCAAESSMIRIASALLIGRIFHGENLMEWYRKRIPLCAGISNINLNRTWIAKHFPERVVEYVRVSPVGPMLPIVFTPSTLGADLHFGLTYRDAVIEPELAHRIAKMFADQLVAIAEGRLN